MTASHRKSIKAFTLMELVVSIAIIAVLSMIIVPNIVEYTRNSKIKAANNNAEIIYRAAQDWLVEQEIDHKGLFPSVASDPTSAFIRSTASNVQAPGQGNTSGSGISFNIEQYISSMVTVEGQWRVVIDPVEYKCVYVSWIQNDTSNILKTDADLYFYDESAQREYINTAQDIVGIYPYKNKA